MPINKVSTSFSPIVGSLITSMPPTVAPTDPQPGSSSTSNKDFWEQSSDEPPEKKAARLLWPSRAKRLKSCVHWCLVLIALFLICMLSMLVRYEMIDPVTRLSTESYVDYMRLNGVEIEPVTCGYVQYVGSNHTTFPTSELFIPLDTLKQDQV